ncbi:MAG TPA: sigma-70 family RNA polymerase sigma factor [Burkholderiales bacterium]|nr:sigma-70 family RNA polymerase sigma factor [Burkholderiales bacterium]
MPDSLSRIATDRSDGAFRRLFEEFGPQIRHYMMRHGADAATAEELAQETLLAVWRKAAQYSAAKGTPATWMFSIARNLRIDRLRREVCWQELSDDVAEGTPSEDTPPDDAASEHQRQARVQAVLAALPEDQRAVVTAAFVDGLSHHDISARLSLPLGTVKSRLRLAYQKVRAALEDLK